MAEHGTITPVSDMATDELLDRLVTVLELTAVSWSDRVLNTLATRAGELWLELATRDVKTR